MIDRTIRMSNTHTSGSLWSSSKKTPTKVPPVAPGSKYTLLPRNSRTFSFVTCVDVYTPISQSGG